MNAREFDLEEYKKIKDPAELKKSMNIEASAGTGKTFTITGIIEKLIAEKFKLKNILVVTYTEKAAGELRDRIRKACPKEDVDNAPIYTIHSFCQKTLAEFSFTANQCANFSVVDKAEIDDFINRWIRDELKNHSDFKRLLISAEKQDSFINSIIAAFKLSVSKYYLGQQNQEVKDIVTLDNTYITIDSHDYTYEDCDNLIEKAQADYDTVSREYNKVFSRPGTKINKEKIADYYRARLYFTKSKELYIAWQKEKEKKKILDYDDLLRSVREAVCAPASSLKKQLQKKYSFAIIDEFQDTNQRQWDIFKTVFMEDDEHTIIVVGDPKQSIYSFQGADVNVYKNAIKSIRDHGGLSYKISTNYRSTDKMVEACNHLFYNFFTPNSDNNFSDSKPSHKKEPAYYDGTETQPFWIGGKSFDTITEKEFAKLTAQTIIDCCSWQKGKTKLQVLGRNVSFRDFAILVRGSNEYPEIESALKKAGIPFIRYKDKNLFFGNECKQWIALFNAITAKDFTGHNRSILSEALFTKFFNISIDEVENEKFDNPSCTERQLIIQWQKLSQERKWAKLLEKIFADTNIENRLSQLDQMQSLTKLRQIGNYAIDYLYRTDCSLEDVCLHLTRLSSDSESSMDDGNLVEKGTDFDCVQLMTIHASKGLEFPVVIVPAGLHARNDSVPRVYSYHQNENAIINFCKENKCKLNREEDNERERIYYVAYTRASSILMLPIYDIWIPAKYNKKAPIHQFLLNSISAMSNMKTTKDKSFVRELQVNNKTDSQLKREVQEILVQLNKHKETQAAAYAADKNLSEEAQLKETKELSLKVPSLEIQKYSYSSLSRKKHEPEEMTVNGGRADKEGADSEEPSLAHFDTSPNPVSYIAVPGSQGVCPPAVSAPDSFPKGSKLGIAIHEVFEKADFSVKQDDEGLSRLITACFEKQTLRIPEGDPDGWLAYTSGILCKTLNAKLPEICGGVQTGNYFKLSEIADKDKISEAEFNMNAGITEAIGITETSNITEASAASALLKNYWNGFIDLVFKREVNGKDVYSVLDWKSNTFEPKQYSDGNYLKSITDEKYSIQRVLYSYSLIKWLASFYKEEYENDTEARVFENHFGGIYYAYVRGCQADTCSGIYARTWTSWQELENAFKKIMGAVNESR